MNYPLTPRPKWCKFTQLCKKFLCFFCVIKDVYKDFFNNVIFKAVTILSRINFVKKSSKICESCEKFKIL